ncbi:hypothetical protein DL93DRAFT_2087654 [Clavulina sp. PMI_390]|nr:hypothetical protein DL93DRAFT_2087654 [Clavulina sp. PMI_390]
MLEDEVAEIASLRYLEIRPYRRSEQIELILLFDYLKVPNVEHFTLNAITLSEDGDEDEVFWPAIVRPNSATILIAF